MNAKMLPFDTPHYMRHSGRTAMRKIFVSERSLMNLFKSQYLKFYLYIFISFIQANDNNLILSFNTELNDDSNLNKLQKFEISKNIRDPFNLKPVKKKITLISVLICHDLSSAGCAEIGKKTAIVEYNNETFLVNKNDIIADKWKVISIENKEIILENLKTQKTEMIVLNYE